MYQFVARANIDHYLGLLNDSDLAPDKRSVVTELLIVEENKLGHDLEHLEFAQTRVARGRERVNRLRGFRETLALGTSERDDADRLLADVESLQIRLEDFCHRLRESIDSRGLR